MLDKYIFTNLIDMYTSLGFGMTEFVLSEPKVQNLLNSNNTFDLVIVELFANEAHMAFAHHYKAPLIVFSSIAASEWVNFFVANPMPPSYVQHGEGGYSASMNFWQRLKNLALYVFELALREFVLYPHHGKLVKQYFPSAPDLQDVMYNVSLVLLNSHPSYTESVPLVPNMIEIGGFHITNESLESNLQEFLDYSKEGVVYFSLGTNLMSKDLPLERRQIFMETFKSLPFKVLWKFEDENLPGRPENVKIQKWLPQRAVLGHPNVKAFVSHCGHISETESVYFGVPLICIPFFGDQPTNAAIATKNGMAVTVDYRRFSRETFEGALNQVLFNRKFSENAKLRSKLMRDRPVKPMDTAMYWIEYVLRYRDVQHLNSAGLSVKWYQYFYLDAVAVFIVSLVVLRKVALRIFKGKTKKAAVASKPKKLQ